MRWKSEGRRGVCAVERGMCLGRKGRGGGKEVGKRGLGRYPKLTM